MVDRMVRAALNTSTQVVKPSVADPDLDQVGSGLFGSPGSGSRSGKIPDPDPLSTKRPL